MDELLKKRCEEEGVDYNILTEAQKTLLRKEIEAEQRGETVLDSVLDNPCLYR